MSLRFWIWIWSYAEFEHAPPSTTLGVTYEPLRSTACGQAFVGTSSTFDLGWSRLDWLTRLECPSDGTSPQPWYGSERPYNGLRLANTLAKWEVGLCGRAGGDDRLVEGAHRSTMDQLADWTLWADKVLTF